jgi:hypothetical protein
MCTAVLIGRDPTNPPPHLGSCAAKMDISLCKLGAVSQTKTLSSQEVNWRNTYNRKDWPNNFCLDRRFFLLVKLKIQLAGEPYLSTKKHTENWPLLTSPRQQSRVSYFPFYYLNLDKFIWKYTNKLAELFSLLNLFLYQECNSLPPQQKYRRNINANRKRQEKPKILKFCTILLFELQYIQEK